MRQTGDQYTCEVCGHCGEQGVIDFGEGEEKEMKTNVEQIMFDFSEESSELTGSLPKSRSVLELEPVPQDFEGIQIGSVCEIVVEDPRVEKLPHLFTETQVGRRIVVTQLSMDQQKRWVWGYQARLRKPLPAGEKRAKRLQYDPACSVAPYPAEWLLLLDQDAAKLTKQLIEE